MLRRTIQTLFPRTAVIANADALREFLHTRAAFISQKATYEYCRARAGVMWDKLMLERDFVAQLEMGRWMAFIAALSDLALVADVVTRPFAEDHELCDALADMAASVLGAEPQLPRAEITVDSLIDEIRVRLAQAALAAPRKVHQIGTRSGRQIFALMPVHPTVREHDETTIVNNVRFLMVRVYEDLAGAVDGPALVADLRRSA